VPFCSISPLALLLLLSLISYENMRCCLVPVAAVVVNYALYAH
jgi:hypothetical protein